MTIKKLLWVFVFNIEIIPLHVNQYRNTNYTIVAKASNIDGLYPFLLDSYTQQYTEIPAGGSATYNYSVVNSDSQSVSSSRFSLVFKNQSSLGNQSLEMESGLLVYPNPVKEGWFMINSPINEQDVEVDVFDLLGQRIPFTISKVNSNSLKIEFPKSITKGVYWVKMNQNGQTTTKTVLIK